MTNVHDTTQEELSTHKDLPGPEATVTCVTVSHIIPDVGSPTAKDKPQNVPKSNESPPIIAKKISQTDLDPKCGWLGFTPGCLQVFHTPRWLLGFMCVMVVIQGTVINGMVASSLSMLEKRFGLSSFQTGVIGAFYDIGVVLLLVLVTYKGGKGHKGRWIAVGCVSMGLGSLCFSLPQFTTGPYEYGSLLDTTCVPGRIPRSSNCSTTSNLSYYFWVFLFAQLLHGFGASPMFTLTFVYIDENVLQKYSAIYTSLLYVASILGPGIGYLSSGAFLNIYGEIGVVSMDAIDITPEDPRWYGAWWLGMFICGVLAFIIAIPLSCYAEQLPKTKTFLEINSKETQPKITQEESSKHFRKTAKDFVTALKNLLVNKPYMFCILSDSMEAFVMGAYATFLPKVVENVFSLSASKASVLVGIITITAAVGGSLFSGLLMYKLKMGCKTMLKYCLICITISIVVCCTFFLILACDNVPYAGVTVQYGTQSPREGMAVLTAECNERCQCSAEVYKPACGEDNLMYFSPCHASCETKINSSTYSNCACIGKNQEGVARKGKCPSSCELMPVYLVSVFVITLFMFMVSTPQVQVILRCVQFSQRSLATGCGWVLARLLGTIPGPIIVGEIFDSTCIAWGTKCGERTSCLVYNIQELVWKIVVATLAVKLVSLLCAILAWFSYKPNDVDENINKEEELVVNADNVASFDQSTTL